jgi:hypothetical protein
MSELRVSENGLNCGIVVVKDYERRVQTSETLITVAMIRLLLRRLAASA